MTTPTIDPEALRAKYRAERDKRLRDDGNEQYIEVAGEFALQLRSEAGLVFAEGDHDFPDAFPGRRKAVVRFLQLRRFLRHRLEVGDRDEQEDDHQPRHQVGHRDPVLAVLAGPPPRLEGPRGHAWTRWATATRSRSLCVRGV